MELSEEDQNRIIQEEKFRRSIRENLNESPKEGIVEKSNKYFTFSRNLVYSVVLILAAIFLLPTAIPLIADFLEDAKVNKASVAGIEFVSKKPLKELIESDGSTDKGSIEITGVDGYDVEIGKGSQEVLRKLRSELATKHPNGIDILTLKPDESYDPKLLNEYIYTLGNRFIVFKQDKIMEGWIDASIFSAQLIEFYQYDGNVNYNQLIQLIGVNNTSVKWNESAKKTLETMKNNHLDNIAVVKENGEFVSILNRGDLLSEVINNLVLE